MTSRTIGCDGLDELPERRPHEQPVEYLITLRARLTTDDVEDVSTGAAVDETINEESTVTSVDDEVEPSNE